MRIGYFLTRAFSLAKIYLNKIYFYLLSDYKFWQKGRGQGLIFKNHPNVSIGDNTTFGVEQSPNFFSTYSYIDCRLEMDSISIGNNCHFNNNLCLIARGASIEINDNCLFGFNVSITTSDFHDLSPANRYSPKDIKCGDVIIGTNVFLGNDVKVLKGVTIGSNSVVAANSTVVNDIPANVIAGGSPAKTIRSI